MTMTSATLQDGDIAVTILRGSHVTAM